MKTKKIVKKSAKKAQAKKQVKRPPKAKAESVETKELKIQIDILKEHIKSQKETINRLRKRNKTLSEKVAKKDSSFPITTVTSPNTNVGTDREFLTKIAAPTPAPVTKAVDFPESPFSAPIVPPAPTKTVHYTETVHYTDLSTFRAPCIQDAEKDPGASLMLSANPLANACAVRY